MRYTAKAVSVCAAVFIAREMQGVPGRNGKS